VLEGNTKPFKIILQTAKFTSRNGGVSSIKAVFHYGYFARAGGADSIEHSVARASFEN
jgi:hypothetical protein